MKTINKTTFFILIFLGLTGLCFAQTRIGIIEVTSEHTTYRDEPYFDPSIVGFGSGGASVSGGGIRTIRVPVKSDRRLSFQILLNGRETFRGTTPVRVTNFDLDTTYTIVWTGTNGTRRQGTFTIPNTSPYTRRIHLE